MADSESDKDLLSDQDPLVYDSQPKTRVDSLASTRIISNQNSKSKAPIPSIQILSPPQAKVEHLDEIITRQRSSISNTGDSKGLTERPNKFHGPPSTWRSWTEPERLLASSLTQLQNQDLALHLYAAHHLKRQLRDPALTEASREWFSKGRWQDQERAASGEGFDPGKRWTAWPLPPENVPREWERWGKPLDEVESSAKRLVNVSSTALLEEICVASAIRLAKDRFNSRPWEPEESKPSQETIKTEPGLPARPKAKSASPEADLKPAILADDEQAHDILRPSIRHIFTQLDLILLALHHSRAMYTTFKPVSSRSRSRSRSASRSTSRSTPMVSKGAKDISVQVPSSLDATRSGPRRFVGRGRGRGRPRKYPRPSEGESYYGMRKRFLASQLPTMSTENSLPARNQSPQPPRQGNKLKNSSPSDSSASSTSSSAPGRKSRARSVSLKSRNSNRRHQAEREERLHARDWNDVLGAAAHTGVKRDIVLKAADRCSRLFGEGVRFRTLDPDGDGEEICIRGDSSQHRGRRLTRRLDGKSDEMDDDRPDLDESMGKGKGEDEDEDDDDYDHDLDLENAQDETDDADEDEEDEEEEEVAEPERRRSLMSGHTIRHGEPTIGGVRRDGFMVPIPVLRMGRGPDVKKRRMLGQKGNSNEGEGEGEGEGEQEAPGEENYMSIDD